MKPTSSLVPPRAATRSYLRAGTAVAIVLVMIGSGVAAAFLLSGTFASGTPANGLPHGGMPVAAVSTLQNGTQLQHDPYLQNPGTPVSTIPNATLEGPLAANTTVSFTVGFQMQNEQELANIIDAQETSTSGAFHQWLTLPEEEQMFGPSQTTVQDTINYFTSLGLHVGQTGPLSISFYGSSSQVSAAFKTSIDNVGYGDGLQGYVNTEPLALPAVLAQAISTVDGIDSATQVSTTDMVNPQVSQEADAGIPAADQPAFNAALARAMVGETGNDSAAYNYSNHAFVWFKYWSKTYDAFREYQVITPASLSNLYQETPLIQQGYNGDSTGTPITIAIIMAGGINPGDIEGFSQMVWNNPMQIMDRLTAMPVDREFGLNGTETYTDGGSNEMALDIEFSSTMAPGAHIVPVYGPYLSTNVLDDDYAAVAGMSTVPNLVSNSWGGAEVSWPNLYGPNWANALTMHDYFMLLSARGSTVLASSADGGGFDPNTGIMSGSFPASDPYVLSVDGLRTTAYGPGGSLYPVNDTYGSYQTNIPLFNFYNQTIHIDQAAGVYSQSFWYVPQTNTTLYNAPPVASGGFGTSYWFTQPWYQHGLYVPNVGRALGSSVGAEADFNETIFFDGEFEWGYGGTSFACPTTAGELAVVEDYLEAHGESGYLGVGDVPIFDVANAWYNGNVSLVPYYNVLNGTSYWGNIGAGAGYQWPGGQDFPKSANGGWYTYGNSTKGYSFPDGWGSINVYNFAQDLLQLDKMPGTMVTVNATSNTYAPLEWANLQMNHSYSIDVNVTSAVAASNPVIGVEAFGQNGVNTSTYFTNAATELVPSSSLRFTLNTSAAPFAPLFSPSLIIITLGNATEKSLGFAYDWVAPSIATGNLTVTVVNPTSGSEVGGYAEFNGFLGFQPPTMDPRCCGTLFPNTFAVQVELDGHPVYDAQVLATIPDTSAIAFENTRLQSVTNSYGAVNYKTTNIVSIGLTNLTGVALVYTWNAVTPTTYFVNATYGPNTAGTTYQVLPGPSIGTTDNYGGALSNFNIVTWVLYATHQIPSNRITATQEDLEEPNAVNEPEYWNLAYGWQGQILQVGVNNYSGAGIGGAKVWVGEFDSGRETKFERYQPSGGVLGITNYTNTSSYTLPNGTAWLQIPDNMSDTNGFTSTADGTTAGLGFLAVDVAGASNRTFQYAEKCTPDLPNPNALISCEFNNSYQRNYTAEPLVVLPNPVNVTVQTPQRLPLDFFNIGQSVSFQVNVSLPFTDPIAGNNVGWNWPAGIEHITKAQAFVDGHYALDLSPNVPPFYQDDSFFGNLSNNYSPGVHNLTVLVWDSAGHVFSDTSRFVVGGVDITNLNQTNVYTVVPYTVNWTLELPSDQVYNYTYNQTFDLRYVTNGCGGLRNPCATVVNLTKRVHDGVLNYNQSINVTLMGLDGFYAGNGGDYPTGQYQIIIWLNQNETGGNSIAAEVNTYLVFTSVQGEITGPGANATVPIGNVTIAFSYEGGYVQNATLDVYPYTDMKTPVFSTGAFEPAIGEELRGGATTWQAVTVGQYDIVLTLGTPYAGNFTAHEWVNVTNPNALVYLNHTLGAKPLISISSAQLATVLAILGVIVGLIVGLLAAPALRPTPGGTTGGTSAPKPWDEGHPGSAGAGVGNGTPVGNGSPAALSCPICHEPATNEYSLHQHQQVVHGIEE
jgi:subtilase family serine protease